MRKKNIRKDMKKRQATCNITESAGNMGGKCGYFKISRMISNK
jgi:hypothetical protein